MFLINSVFAVVPFIPVAIAAYTVMAAPIVVIGTLLMQGKGVGGDGYSQSDLNKDIQRVADAGDDLFSND